ncbi:MAG TPA: CHAT domain-containing protein, partial [Thermoanaerobaculia bacterium]|nr:CHAT domain-containing protein [Thermoanaerobaculia bacterium]
HLARLLGQFNQNLRCVVLNACYSEEQAQAIAQEVDCVVGMATAVADRAAIRFAAKFYEALAFGQTVQAAFDLACSDIEINELGQDAVPHLLARRRSAQTLRFAAPART